MVNIAQIVAFNQMLMVDSQNIQELDLEPVNRNTNLQGRKNNGHKIHLGIQVVMFWFDSTVNSGVSVRLI